MLLGLTILSDGIQEILNGYTPTARIVGTVGCFRRISTRLVWSGGSGRVPSWCHGFVVMKGQNDTSDVSLERIVVPERVQDCHCLMVKDEKSQPGPGNVLMSQTRLARNGFAQRFDAQAPPVLGCAPWGRKGCGGVSTRQQGGYCRMT